MFIVANHSMMPERKLTRENVQDLSTEELLDYWATHVQAQPQNLLDLAHVPDHRLLLAVVQDEEVLAVFRREGSDLADDPAMLADSAIAELAKRAEQIGLTVGEYVRRGEN
jgi:hypothetical protein